LAHPVYSSLQCFSTVNPGRLSLWHGYGIQLCQSVSLSVHALQGKWPELSTLWLGR